MRLHTCGPAARQAGSGDPGHHHLEAAAGRHGGDSCRAGEYDQLLPRDRAGDVPPPSTNWLITASHCFSGLEPPASLSVDGASTVAVGSTTAQNLYFHPQAIANGETRWTAEFANTDVDCAHDLALVRLPAGIQGVTPAKVYHGCGSDPACAPVDSLSGIYGGWDQVVGVGQATAQFSAGQIGLRFANQIGCHSPSNDQVNIAAGSSEGQEGDSGGGLFIQAPSNSQSFGGVCDTLSPANQGETGLVGVVWGGDGVTTIFTPIYRPESAALDNTHTIPNSKWLFDTIHAGRDGDAICDAFDNCPGTPNNDQANSNYVAENAWGGGDPNSTKGHLGDKCDPAPTPVVGLSHSLTVTGFRAPILNRAIADQITIHPVIEPGDSVQGKAAAAFCLCRKPDGTPINDPTQCSNPPWNCKLEPWYQQRASAQDPHFTEVATPLSGPLLHPTDTTWHLISASEPGTPFSVPDYPLPEDYHHIFNMSYPGKDHTATWKYQADNDYWNLEGYFDNHPASPAPGYPPGTDLGGVLWMDDNTPAGAAAHGLQSSFGTGCTLGSCDAESIADSYDFGAAPDRRIRFDLDFRHYYVIPIPPFPGASASGSQHFPGGDPLQPLPVVSLDPATGSSVYWLSAGRRFPADSILSPTLRQQLLDPTLRWVPASEPVSVTQFPDMPRAAALASDGSELANFIVETDRGYQSSSEGIIIGGGGGRGPVNALSQLPTPGTRLRNSMLAHADGPTPRADFAATWSRVSGELSVAGGHDAAGQAVGDVWTLRSTGWDQETLFGAAPPADVESATWAWKDQRMWLVDDVAPASPSARPRRVLYRLQTTSGWIDGTWTLGALGWADHVWLTTAADGRVVLTAAGKDHWLLALMSSHRCGEPGPSPQNLHGASAGQSGQHGCDRVRLSVDGFVRGKGGLAAPPQIQYGRVTGAFLEHAGSRRALDVRFIADLAKLDHGPSELDADFR